MICTMCFEEDEQAVEMDLVNTWLDTYDERGEHVEIDTGKLWICPRCDHEEILEDNK